MTLERARELLQVQIQIGGGYNRNATRFILYEVSKHHGQGAVDGLIREFSLDELFHLKVGVAIKPY